MIRALIFFELVRRVKVVSTYVYAVLLFGAGLLMMLAAGGAFSSVTVATGNERVYANSPQSLFGTIGIVALFGIFTVAAIFGQAAYQDFGHGTWMIIFTKNVKKTPYLIGRFLGAFIFSALLFVTIGLGQAVGAVVVHFLHPEMIGKTSILGYFWPYLTLVWPMLFFTGALFFMLAGITRKMAPVYVGAVILILGYLLTTTVVQDVENLRIAGLLDPFGFLAFSVTTRYWTPAEQNRDLAPMISLFGANRVVWTAVGVALLGLTIQRFRTTVDEQKGRRSEDLEVSQDATPFPRTMPEPSTLGWVRASVGFAWMHFKEIVRSPVFWALIVSAMFFCTLIVLVANIGRIPTLVDCVGKARGVPSYLIINGMLGSAFLDEGKYATVINAYSTSIKEHYFRGMNNIVCLGDPRMDAYVWEAPLRQINRETPTVTIGASGHNNTDMNSYLAVEFEFLFDVLQALCIVKDRGMNLRVVIKVRSNGYREQYEQFCREYFPGLVGDIVDKAPIKDILEQTDFFISIYSQTLFEASCMGIPCLYYKKDDEIKDPPFDGHSELVTVDDVDGLVKALFDFQASDKRFDAFLDKSVMERYVGPLDGKNLERNLAFVHELLAKDSRVAV